MTISLVKDKNKLAL